MTLQCLHVLHFKKKLCASSFLKDLRSTMCYETRKSLILARIMSHLAYARFWQLRIVEQNTKYSSRCFTFSCGRAVKTFWSSLASLFRSSLSVFVWGPLITKQEQEQQQQQQRLRMRAAREVRCCMLMPVSTQRVFFPMWIQLRQNQRGAYRT